MSPALDNALEDLLRQSLRAWRVTGDVRREHDGTLLLMADTRQVRVARMADNPHFRWTVAVGDHTRRVGAIAGVLRATRAAIDPSYKQVRLRIAPLPPLGPL